MVQWMKNWDTYVTICLARIWKQNVLNMDLYFAWFNNQPATPVLIELYFHLCIVEVTSLQRWTGVPDQTAYVFEKSTDILLVAID